MEFALQYLLTHSDGYEYLARSVAHGGSRIRGAGLLTAYSHADSHHTAHASGNIFTPSSSAHPGSARYQHLSPADKHTGPNEYVNSDGYHDSTPVGYAGSHSYAFAHRYRYPAPNGNPHTPARADANAWPDLDLRATD